MGLSIRVLGLVPADVDWDKKVAAFEALKAAGMTKTDAYEKLREFLFEDSTEEEDRHNIAPRGKRIYLREPVVDGRVPDDETCVIDLAKLPPGVTKIMLKVSC